MHLSLKSLIGHCEGLPLDKDYKCLVEATLRTEYVVMIRQAKRNVIAHTGARRRQLFIDAEAHTAAACLEERSRLQCTQIRYESANELNSVGIANV